MESITVVYTGPWEVKLTYFKKSGKFYGNGSYLSKKVGLWEIWEEINNMFKNQKMPGLIDGPQDFITYVEVPAHPHNHPILIIP